MEIRVRGFDVYPPYRDELPLDLFEPPHSDDFYGPSDPPSEFTRIAKTVDQVIGVYELDRIETGVFKIRSLIVDRSFRRQGVGRWLLGHAIGVAESKGGRQVVLASNRAKAFFSKFDFYEVEGALKFDLVPD